MTGPTPELLLSAKYRRLMRWYPRSWRLANEEAMLGTLLDLAESELRPEPNLAERLAITKAGLAQRFAIPARSSSPHTLLLGGVGLVLATVNPFVGRAVFIFPVPNYVSWLYGSWQSIPQQVSALVFVAALTVLAIGVKREPGIAARSIIGKVALIVFAVANFSVVVLNSQPLLTVGTSPSVLVLVPAATWSCVLLGLVALVVGAIAVFRSGAVRGVGRWGLIVLAAATAVPLALERIPSVAVGGLAELVGYPIELVIQLFIGVLFIRMGLTTLQTNRHTVATPPLRQRSPAADKKAYFS